MEKLLKIFRQLKQIELLKEVNRKKLLVLSPVLLLLIGVMVYQLMSDADTSKANVVAKTGISANIVDMNPGLANSSTVSANTKVSPAISTTLFGNPGIKNVVTLPIGNTQYPLFDKPVLSSANRIDCLVEPHKVVEVASATSGVIKKVNVERGAVVKKGDILAILENGVERANVKLAAARLKYAQENFTRMQKLYTQKVVSFQEKDKAETEKNVALLELKRARELLRKRTIISPLSGIVVKRYISPGELTEQQKIMKIAQIDPLKIEVVASIKMLGTMRKGMQADIWPEGPRKGPFKARVTIVDRVVDAASGTFGVRLTMPNPKNRIPAGVKCEAAFSKGGGRIVSATHK